MCARYTFFSSEEYLERFQVVKPDRATGFKSYNIAPGSLTPVIIRQSPNQAKMMKFGFIPFWAKDPRIGFKMFNARAEGIATKPSFRKAIHSQRCLVPADGFYEWKTLTLEDKPEKIPWYFSLKDQKVFSMAGIFDIWKDAESRETWTFAIITTEPNEIVAKIHDRMPVILAKDEENRWLDPNNDMKNVLTLLDTFPAKEMESRPVSKDVNRAGNDSPELIYPRS